MTVGVRAEEDDLLRVKLLGNDIRDRTDSAHWNTPALVDARQAELAPVGHRAVFHAVDYTSHMSIFKPNVSAAILLRFAGHPGGAFGAAFSPDGKFLLASVFYDKGTKCHSTRAVRAGASIHEAYATAELPNTSCSSFSMRRTCGPSQYTFAHRSHCQNSW